MIRDAASSSTCSGASGGGSGLPSDGSPQIQPARPCSSPHSAAAGSPAPADSVSVTPPVFTQSYFTSNHLTSKYLRPERTEDCRRWAPGVVVPIQWLWRSTESLG